MNNKHRCYGILATLFFGCSAGISAATITAAEYFWNSDPGVGNGTSLLAKDGAFNSNYEELNASVVVPSTLKAGPNKLYLRMKGSGGAWGVARPHLVMVTGQKQLTQVEYFINTDPGEGKGVSLAQESDLPITENEITINAILPVNDLSVGVHKLFLRAKDSEGSWGTARYYTFEVYDSGTIKAAKFFIGADPLKAKDSDFASLNADDGNLNQAVENVSTTFSTAALSWGTHPLWIVTQDSLGRWGQWAQTDITLTLLVSAYTYDLGQGWKYNGLGFIYDGFYPFVFVWSISGWLYCEGVTEEGYYAYDFNNARWLWMGSSFYPWTVVLSGSQSGQTISLVP